MIYDEELHQLQDKDEDVPSLLFKTIFEIEHQTLIPRSEIKYVTT